LVGGDGGLGDEVTPGFDVFGGFNEATVADVAL
jgi:hypothetical protein